MDNRVAHLGLIIDGNRRFSKKYGGSLNEAYALGAQRVYEVIRYVFTKCGVKELSIFALSYDNLTREPDEVQPILEAQKETFDRWATDPFFEREKVRIRFAGEMSLLPKDMQESCQILEKKTAAHDGHSLNILLAYSGQREISMAAEHARLTFNGKEKTLSETESTSLMEKEIQKNLQVQTPVDLIIRSGSEFRLSGFLPWQSEYAELYSVNKLWPEMTVLDILTALTYFNKRKRNNGK